MHFKAITNCPMHYNTSGGGWGKTCVAGFHNSSENHKCFPWYFLLCTGS